MSDADAIIMAVYQRMTADQRPHLLNLLRGLTDDDWPLVERSMIALNVEQHMPTVRAVMKMEG
ncbi:hypothetical protein E6C67_26835 [Azospirillum sp. TSA2s]|uniref:hypothetical protein n=1 Tax=Azospirillum sp. TSA2s TaxID=709810 RepID=UPI0010AAF5B6|nr:hypothetical protein [Azospirillum sp. TSA2s]QCG97390.1 hypothetical protein E6C67_26835 [Azospirillum sp. TSA2s]